MTLPHLAVLTATAVSVICLIRQYRWNSRSKNCALPPGPKGWPIIGNFLDLSSLQKPWVLYANWASTFGPIMYLQMLQTPMIVISSARIASDLLEKRSSIYSDRPVSVMDELMGWDWNMGVMRYGQRWRGTRRYFHQHFNQFAVPKYWDKQSRGVHTFLLRMLDSGGEVTPDAIRLMLASLLFDVVYGMQIDSMDDEAVQTVEEAANILLAYKIPGSYWIDYTPILRYVPTWVPGAKAKQLAARARPLVERSRNQGFDFVKSIEYLNDSVASTLLTRLRNINGGENHVQEQYAIDASGIAYFAGIDTTVSFLSFFLNSIVYHPEIQKKAQEELDRVVGTTRLPTFEDRESMPYTQAVVRECIRSLPIVPLGVPHAASTDDYYEEYFIPKDTIVWTNIWTMLRDPEDYPDPERFNPERFLQDGRLNPGVRDPTTLFFGFGRRVCPGRYLAMDNAFLAIASILHVFNASYDDRQGAPFDPNEDVVTRLVTMPIYVKCILEPRSKAAQNLIRSSR